MSDKVNRIKSRRLLFQELYSMVYNNIDKDLFLNSFYDSVFSFSKDEKYIESMVKTITYYEKFFIFIINKYTPKYKIEKMSPIYILPIYMGLAEMFFLDEEIPAKVTINEAVQIAKSFWDDSSKKIVNGVLNTVIENYDELNKIKENDYNEISVSFFK